MDYGICMTIVLIIGAAIFVGISNAFKLARTGMNKGSKKRSFQKSVGSTNTGKLAMHLYQEYEGLSIRDLDAPYGDDKLEDFIQSVDPDEAAGAFKATLESNNVKMQRIGIHGIYFLCREAERAWNKEQTQFLSISQDNPTEIEFQERFEEYDKLRLSIAGAIADPLYKIGAINPLLDLFYAKDTDKDARKDAAKTLLQVAKLCPIEGKPGFIYIYKIFLKSTFSYWDDLSIEYVVDLMKIAEQRRKELSEETFDAIIKWTRQLYEQLHNRPVDNKGMAAKLYEEIEVQEQRYEYSKAKKQYEKRMKIGTQERVDDGKTLWDAVMRIQLERIRESLPMLARKKRKYLQKGDYGEVSFNSRSWDSELLYFIVSVLLNKPEYAPRGASRYENQDNKVRYFFVDNKTDPDISPIYDKYFHEERPPRMPQVNREDNTLSDEDQEYFTGRELEKIMFNYLQAISDGEIHQRNYTNAIISIIEHEIEKFESNST